MRPRLTIPRPFWPVSRKGIQHLSTLSSQFKPLSIIADPSLSHFREQYFAQDRPILFPKGHFSPDLPAIRNWFKRSHLLNSSSDIPATVLNTDYLMPHSHTFVNLEQTTNNGFNRFAAPFGVFLLWCSSKLALKAAPDISAPLMSLYLAQTPISSLPPALQADLPTPGILRAGRGDIYASSIWLGIPPTFTPLHRDPNPNLFVQLIGRKLVRIITPQLGDRVFAACRENVGPRQSGAMRGDEMMMGKERDLLDAWIWEDDFNDVEGLDVDEKILRGGELWEAEVSTGDGIFIPKGWWHSVKGIGVGMNGSANWWFR